MLNRNAIPPGADVDDCYRLARRLLRRRHELTPVDALVLQSCVGMIAASAPAGNPGSPPGDGRARSGPRPRDTEHRLLGTLAGGCE